MANQCQYCGKELRWKRGYGWANHGKWVCLNKKCPQKTDKAAEK